MAASGRLAHLAKPFRAASRTARVLVLVGVAITLFFVLVALVGPLVAPYGGEQFREVAGDVTSEQLPRLEQPTGAHPFGTTRDRYDVLGRVIGGAQLALVVVLVSTVLAMVVGVPLGLVSGYRGGRVDRLLVTTMDAVYVFPPLLLAIITAFVLSRFLRPGVPSAAAAVAVTYVPQYYRVVRNQTLSVKELPFVEAARSLGAPERTVLGRYVFFNVVQSVPVIFTLNAADAVLTLASLGFLGYGVTPPTPEWGYDISQAVNDITAGVWWTAFWPGIAIVALVTGLTLIGEGLNDVVNPLLRARGLAGARIGMAGVGVAGGEVGGEVGAEDTVGAHRDDVDVSVAEPLGEPAPTSSDNRP